MESDNIVSMPQNGWPDAAGEVGGSRDSPSKTLTSLAKLHEQMIAATYSREFFDIQKALGDRLNRMDEDMKQFRTALGGLSKLVESHEAMKRDLEIMMAQNRQFLSSMLEKENAELKTMLDTQKENLKKITAGAGDPLGQLGKLLEEQVTVFQGFHKFADHAVMILIMATSLGALLGGVIANWIS
ncbi:DNA replication initiation control protein YabA [Acidithiobacillus sp. VAN18-1]|uniref:DNA replication initiation control protein YabA n=1 Tax=Igneacidithiobacillus copahuensis TaxID=2724909 RepID=A0AAE2YQT1_9PROT|nr:hypothetical protein [Igneacidithiobacillus copahuensis]MBU2788669.1 DNA replication initiation control protein YabA [Igneacidithiobacillus copahuensis]MBU2796647.1 DNA replication initiation control protein YabA [Acidithiobacillus sp. VAN18-2]